MPKASSRNSKALAQRWADAPAARRLIAVGVLALASLSVAVACGVRYMHETTALHNAQQVTWAMQTLGETLSNAALRASQGDPLSIQTLKHAQNSMNRDWALLDQGGTLTTTTNESIGVRPVAGTARTVLGRVGPAINDVSAPVNALIKNERALTAGPIQSDQLVSAVRRATDTARTLATLPALNATPWQNVVLRLLQDLQREDVQNIGYVFSPDPSAAKTQQALADLLRGRAKDINSLAADVARSATSTTVRQQFAQIAAQMTEVSQMADGLVMNLPARIQARDEQAQVAAKVVRLNGVLNDLNAALVNDTHDADVWFYAAWAALLVMVASGIAFYPIAQSQTQESTLSRQEREEVERIESAVEKLVGELDRVAHSDGLISLQARVTATKGEITHRVSKAVNNILDTFMTLAQQVERRVGDVNGATMEADKFTAEVVKIVEDQQQKLAEAGESVLGMANEMGRVADRSSQARLLAQTSLETSQNGGEVVQDTIRRMDAIRDTIQDTSKRIKRLSESSQSIGEVTDLIRDIAKQVQVLSMNAAIEAAAAGDAGRNFAVVAQEIQRLAKNSNRAAKKIDELVVVIQDDAKGAVAAMEASTTEVVEGARLADKAGDALKEIETVSNKLANEVQDVAVQINAQADTASGVSVSMRVLQEFAEQGLVATLSAGAAVERVRDIAKSLQQAASDLAPQASYDARSRTGG